MFDEMKKSSQEKICLGESALNSRNMLLIMQQPEKQMINNSSSELDKSHLNIYPKF